MNKQYYISHASDGYDAEYAHWYYENYVKKGLTKGRDKSSRPQSKEDLAKQRDQELEAVRTEKKGVMAQLSDNRNAEIKQQRENLKRDLKAYRAATKDQIQRMWLQLKSMSIDEREAQEGAFRDQLEALKKTNAQQRELLENTYAEEIDSIREDYKQIGSEFNDYYKGLSKQIVNKYKNMSLSDLGSMVSNSSAVSRSSAPEESKQESTKQRPKKLGSVASPKRERENKTRGAGYNMYKLGQ